MRLGGKFEWIRSPSSTDSASFCRGALKTPTDLQWSAPVDKGYNDPDFIRVAMAKQRFELGDRERAKLAQVCKAHHVRELALFGSSVTGRFDPVTSDLDFAVVFERSRDLGPADQYFGLLEALEQLFGCPVDLVSENAVRNRFFLEELNETKVSVYAA